MVNKGIVAAASFGFGLAAGVAGFAIVRRVLEKARQGTSVYSVSQFVPPAAAERLLVID